MRIVSRRLSEHSTGQGGRTTTCAYLRRSLQEAKEALIRGHELVKQEDGSVLIAPLSVHSGISEGKSLAHSKVLLPVISRGNLTSTFQGLLLRFDIPASEAIKAEVMVLVKGPLEVFAQSSRGPRSKQA
eukprot:768351-Hanusia_phi.AAC.12